MNRWQKIAWYNLIVIVTVFTLSGVAIGTLAIIVGMPGALGGLGLLGFLGFLGLTPIIFRKKKGGLKIDFDERDQVIWMRATVGAYSVFWLVFTAACMIPWFIIGPKGTIPIYVLPAMLAGGFVIVQLIQSIAILIQYRWGAKGEKS